VADRSTGWSLMSLTTRLAIALAVAAALGFPPFVWSLARAPSAAETADGIVVVTGGEERLASAVELLKQRKGARLLISGVHQETTRAELLQRVQADRHLFTCCVDLGRSAENTIGNAGETATWVRDNGYRSIIIVTANYHMPRTLLEFQAAMPETRLAPFPVFPDRVRLDEWWSDPQTTAILIGEYGKFVAAYARVTAAGLLGLQNGDAPTTIERGEAPPPPGSASETTSAGD
jgi:uncharacterized SAM-binding protein YcdF (DUF218 family)